LTRRTTRRQALALAAAGAWSLPLLRSYGAAAATGRTTDLCQRGCANTAIRITGARLDRCLSQTGGRLAALTAVLLYSGNIFGYAASAGANFIGASICANQAQLNGKAMQWDCLQPGCPGFDPFSEYGPCRNCKTIPNCLCCPDPSALDGYTYCNSRPPQPECCAGSGGCQKC
jgi:hypothetical protein